MSKELMKKVINALYTKLGHLLEEIIQATGKAMDLQLIGILVPCKACALEKLKRLGQAKLLYHAQHIRIRSYSLK